MSPHWTRPQATRTLLVFQAGLLAASCQAGAEIGWSIAPLREVLALNGSMTGATLELRLAFASSEGRPLGPEDRIRASKGIFRLGRLQARDMELVEGLLRGPSSAEPLAGPPSGLGHAGAARPLRLVLLVDNSAAAGAADPGLGRLAGSRVVLESVACREGCPLGPGEVELLVMQDGEVLEPDPSAERASLAAALRALASSAGGTAPLLDGLVQAIQRARSGASKGQSGAVVCYTADGPDSSRRTVADLERALAVAPVPRLVILQQQGRAMALLGAVKLSQGAWLPVGEVGSDLAWRAAAAALGGAWQLEWALPAAVPGAERLEGTLSLSLGEPQPRLVSLQVPLLP